MIFSDRLRNICAAFIMLTVCADIYADDFRMLSRLPRHSAVVAGADIYALCRHRQSAPFFLSFKGRRGSAEFASLKTLVCSADAVGRRAAMIFEFRSAAALDGIYGKLAGRFTHSERCGKMQVDFLHGKPDTSGIVRMIRLGEKIAAVYTGYPRRERFTADTGGVAKEILQKLPAGENAVLWCAGFPKFPDKPLSEVESFKMTVKADGQGALTVRGEVLCADTLNASLALIAMPGALSLLLKKYCEIPVDITISAVNSLNIRQDGRRLVFSTTDLDSLFKLFSLLLERNLSIIERSLS